MVLFSTILAGTCVFIASQFILKLWIAPAIELKKAIADMSTELLFHQAKITNNRDQEDEISVVLKRCSAKLRSSDSIVPKNEHVRSIFQLPVTGKILGACHELNLIANNLIERDKGSANQNHQSLGKIEKLLGTSTSYSDRRNSRAGGKSSG